MNLDLRDLELIRQVAADGSLTAAAKQLHVTQSALSHRLQDLERRIGVALFRREARRMVPTLAGERLARTADRVLGEVRVAWDEASAMGERGVSVLRMSTACYTGYTWLPGVLDRFREAYPGVEVQIDAEATRRAVDAVRGGTIDLALCPGPVEDDGLESEPLFRDELVGLVPPGHPLVAEPYLDPTHFRDQHVITYSDDPRQSFFLGGLLAPAGVTPRRATGVPLTEAIVELVKAGQGVTALARWAVADSIERGELVALPIGADGFHRTWHAVRLSRETMPSHLTSFIELLRSALTARVGSPIS